MRTYAPVTLGFSLLAGAVVAACDKDERPAETKPLATTSMQLAAPAFEIGEEQLTMYQPLPMAMLSEKNPLTDEKIALGRQLYYDTRLSKNHDISCNTCHDLAKFGVDHKPVSPGHKAQNGTRNSPTAYNAAGHFAQFWDGRAATVEEQATLPILNPVEMAMPDATAVVTLVRSIPGYVESFKEAFPDAPEPVTIETIGQAIGAFERRLVTPARWDRYLQGDKGVLTDDEKKGFLAYVEAGCGTCHSGRYLGGTMFQRLGAVKQWPADKDQGRFEVTKNEAEKMMFKVPSLRNIEKTAPYFHDGSEPSLENAIKLMGTHQLGKDLDEDQVTLIARFLATLTGEIPAEYIKQPELPPSGKTTPKPNPN